MQAASALDWGWGDRVKVFVRALVEFDKFGAFRDRRRAGNVLVDEFGAPSLQRLRPSAVRSGTDFLIDEANDSDADKMHHVLPGSGSFVRKATFNVCGEIDFVLHTTILPRRALAGEWFLSQCRQRQRSQRMHGSFPIAVPSSIMGAIQELNAPIEGEPSPLIPSPDLQQRQDEFNKWVAEVRDPADQSSEGVRRLVTRCGKASAEYEVARLPNGRWALQTSVEYHTGDCCSTSCGWAEIGTREECIAEFLLRARLHFRREISSRAGESDETTVQQQARLSMISLLRDDSLFGFMEPEIDQKLTRWYEELRMQASE